MSDPQKPIGRHPFSRKLLALVESLATEQKQEWRDALLEQTSMFLPIQTEDWRCPAGHRRELMGEEGSRRLRCPICEGHDGIFLTEFDHEFLRDAGVRIQAD